MSTGSGRWLLGLPFAFAVPFLVAAGNAATGERGGEVDTPRLAQAQGLAADATRVTVAGPALAPCLAVPRRPGLAKPDVADAPGDPCGTRAATLAARDLAKPGGNSRPAPSVTLPEFPFPP